MPRNGESTGRGGGRSGLDLWPSAVAGFTAIGTAIAAFRLLMIAGGSPQVAGSILATTGYVNVAFSMLFLLVPFGLISLLMYALYRWAPLRADADQVFTQPYTGAFLFFSLAVLVYRIEQSSSWVAWSLIAVIGLLFIMGLSRKVKWLAPVERAIDWANARLAAAERQPTHDHLSEDEHWGAHASQERALFGWAVAILVPTVALLALSPKVWLPAEALMVRTDSGQEALIGYYLGESDGFVHVLDEETRVVIHLPEGSLEAREVCVLEEGDILTRQVGPVHSGNSDDEIRLCAEHTE